MKRETSHTCSRNAPSDLANLKWKDSSFKLNKIFFSTYSILQGVKACENVMLSTETQTSGCYIGQVPFCDVNLKVQTKQPD